MIPQTCLPASSPVDVDLDQQMFGIPRVNSLSISRLRWRRCASLPEVLVPASSNGSEALRGVFRRCPVIARKLQGNATAAGYISMFSWITAQAIKVREARNGAVAIQVGLLAVVLIGFSALAVEIGFAYSKQRQMQTVADAAATGGAAALSDTVPDPTGEARSIAGRLGFVSGVSGVVVTVNHPPLNGVHVGDTNSVEVIVQQPQTLSMANLVTSWYGTGPKVWTVAAAR